MRLLLSLCLSLFAAAAQAQELYLFAGTYTDRGSKGIYVYRFNTRTGQAVWVSNTDSVANPSYLTIAPGGRFVYAVNETGGSQPGGVSAFSFDRATGRLTFLNRQPSGGDHPCHITTDRQGKWVVVGNYTGGNLSALPIRADGALQPPTQLVQHSGSSINAARQEKAHVHAAVLSPDQQYLFSPDLGTDKVMAYRFLPNTQKPLQPAQPPFAASAPGSGPRHFTFHPRQKRAYLMEELSGTVAVFSYNNGQLAFLQRIDAHPAGYTGARGSADIHLSPDGKFLYASNRGDANSIAIFSVLADGRLKWKGHQPSLGIAPRNFVIDPTGNYLLVANQQTNNIVIFRRNRQTGLLQDTGQQIEVPNPVCLQFLQ